MRLISMIDYVLTNKYTETGHKNYAKFLKQPLELWMFVPCDKEGNVLEEPKHNGNPLDIRYSISLCEKYQKAKERCLFEDCIYDKEMQVIRKDYGIDLFYIPKHELFTIETMTNYDLTLTQTAIKQIL